MGGRRIGLTRTARWGAALALVTATGLGAPAAAAATSGGAPTASEITIEPLGNTVLSIDGRPYAGDAVLAPDGSGLAVVDDVGFEQYVEGIGEMPSNWPLAALQAQAVAARTYALWYVLTHPAGAAGGRICATDYCQVYAGLSKADGPDGANWVEAVRSTSGVVMQYQNRVIEAVYGSSDGGSTIYGGVPWLPAVQDPQDSLAPEHRWSWSEPLSYLAPLLGIPSGQTLRSLVSSPTAITESLVSATGAVTTVALDPDSFHSILNSRMPSPAGMDLPLPSWRYSVSTYGSTVVVSGMGDGEGLGMSQYGALGKALDGWSAGQILGSYYRGVTAGPLPAGYMPRTISVTLASDRSSATVDATGPVRVLGPGGQVLATTTSPGGWAAQPGGDGVALQPTPGAGPTIAIDPGGDLAPVPSPVSYGQAAGPSSAPAARSGPATADQAPARTSATGTPPAPATLTADSPGPSPDAVAAPPEPATAASGGGITFLPPASAGRRHGTDLAWWGALAALALVAVSAATVRSWRPMGLLRPARRHEHLTRLRKRGAFT